MTPNGSICGGCNGTGRMRYYAGDGAGFEYIACLRCQTFCRGCNRWVPQDGHQCLADRK